MAEVRKVLGQSAPAAATLTDLYTVPASKEAVVSTVVACNRSTAGIKIRIAVSPNGVADANAHYLVRDVLIPGQDSKFFTVGITMDASDVLRVYADTANASFNAFGAEIDV